VIEQNTEQDKEQSINSNIHLEKCTPCCDFDNPVHAGRAKWLCPDCNRDYSLEYFLYQEAEEDEIEMTVSRKTKPSIKKFSQVE
jgi:transposase-like protein